MTMNTDTKILQIVDALIAKTESADLTWEPGLDARTFVAFDGTFRYTVFARSVFSDHPAIRTVAARHSSKSSFILLIAKSDGKLIQTVDDAGGDLPGRLERLYRSARDHVVGETASELDAVLQSVLSYSKHAPQKAGEAGAR